MTQYLSTLDVLAMNDELLRQAGQGGSRVLDEHGLQSALLRAQMAAFYEGADIVSQAAALIVGVALAHAFLDGNKRTALAAGTTFLLLNGYQIVSEPLELAKQIEAVVLQSRDYRQATARFVEWLRDHIQSL